jgi:hypothetical protein
MWPPTGNGNSDKAALEHRKLALETTILEFRGKLEEQKLKHEIRELQQAPRRAQRSLWVAVSDICLKVLVAGVAGLISWQVAQFSGSIALQVARIADRQKSAETYACWSILPLQIFTSKRMRYVNSRGSLSRTPIDLPMPFTLL